ncbi:hypothetical protein J7I84_11770 [Arthrobacter sp. ISL-85]|uniref:Ig-like domain-containing protein n=1 Tax=Arthrobacter sp. ISL-85 TaxID=2819115 RepID=UPI001BEC0C79|nr:Ig-like domain-containing protein [Arthrobacter sp. ISL-85]MBT2567161.1 hypothetical protein [Arthrobacter sp. ISL-85]
MSLAVRNASLFVGHRPSRRLAWIITAVLLLLGSGTAAYAFWASTTSSNNAAAAADTLAPGSKPAVSANGAALSVTWANGTTINGRPATGYTVARYSAATGGTAIPATGGCAGTVTTLTCTEQNVPGGTWYYTVTPAIALWTGAESPRSNGISSDTLPPTASASVSPTPNAGWNNTSPVTVTVTADDGTNGSGVASITYAVDGGAQQTVRGAKATIPVTGDGTHSVSYFATDNAGNVGSTQNQTVKIDTQAPIAPAFASVPGYVNSATVSGVTVSGTAEAGATVTLTATDSAGHAVPVSATASGTGAWSATLNLSSLNQGTVTYSAAATDAAGNTGTSNTATSTKDTLAPAAAQGLSVPQPYVNSAAVGAVPVSGTAEAGAGVTVSATSAGSATPVTGTATASGGPWSMNLDLTSLKDGTVTYSVTVKDPAGNTSAPATATDTKDTVAPAPTITAPMYASKSSAVTGTTEAGTVVSVTVRDFALKPVTTQVTPIGTSWSTTMDISSLSDGTLTYTVTATDAAGNTGSATAAGTKDTSAPAVTGITISGTGGKRSGTPDSGDTITLKFSKSMDPARSCAGWTGTQTLNGTATLTDAGTSADTMTFASSNCPGMLGTMSLGANYIASGATATFGGNGNGNATTFTFDSTAQILTIKLGGIQNGSGTPLSAAAGIPTLAPAATLTDLAGNTALSGAGNWGTSGF